MVSPAILANINFKIFKKALLDDIINEIFELYEMNNSLILRLPSAISGDRFKILYCFGSLDAKDVDLYENGSF